MFTSRHDRACCCADAVVIKTVCFTVKCRRPLNITSSLYSIQPDWQPLFVQLAVLRINLRQQLASVLGVVSNALMQSLIIALLIFNMVVRYFPVDSYNLYICAVVIRVTELVMPLWFCCSLWNFKQLSVKWFLVV